MKKRHFAAVCRSLEQTAAAAAGTVREMFGGRAVVISELDKAACLQ